MESYFACLVEKAQKSWPSHSLEAGCRSVSKFSSLHPFPILFLTHECDFAPRPAAAPSTEIKLNMFYKMNGRPDKSILFPRITQALFGITETLVLLEFGNTAWTAQTRRLVCLPAGGSCFPTRSWLGDVAESLPGPTGAGPGQAPPGSAPEPAHTRAWARDSRNWSQLSRAGPHFSRLVTNPLQEIARLPVRCWLSVDAKLTNPSARYCADASSVKALGGHISAFVWFMMFIVLDISHLWPVT